MAPRGRVTQPGDVPRVEGPSRALWQTWARRFHRVVKAALLKLAADVELATPANEGWCVNIEEYTDASGRVYLELASATPEEAEDGMALLAKLVG